MEVNQEVRYKMWGCFREGSREEISGAEGAVSQESTIFYIWCWVVLILCAFIILSKMRINIIKLK